MWLRNASYLKLRISHLHSLTVLKALIYTYKFVLFCFFLILSEISFSLKEKKHMKTKLAALLK